MSRCYDSTDIERALGEIEDAVALAQQNLVALEGLTELESEVGSLANGLSYAHSQASALRTTDIEDLGGAVAELVELLYDLCSNANDLYSRL